jgi:hypothetical protein
VETKVKKLVLKGRSGKTAKAEKKVRLMTSLPYLCPPQRMQNSLL